MARKGDDSEERPHRAARLVDVPEPVEIVPAKLLVAVLKRRASIDESECRPAPVSTHPGDEAWSEGDVREMLRCVRMDRPPYDEWVRLIAATCDALGGDEAAAAAASGRALARGERGRVCGQAAQLGSARYRAGRCCAQHGLAAFSLRGSGKPRESGSSRWHLHHLAACHRRASGQRWARSWPTCSVSASGGCGRGVWPSAS